MAQTQWLVVRPMTCETDCAGVARWVPPASPTSRAGARRDPLSNSCVDEASQPLADACCTGRRPAAQVLLAAAADAGPDAESRCSHRACARANRQMV